MIIFKIDAAGLNEIRKFPSQINNAVEIGGERLLKDVAYRTQMAMKFFAPASGIPHEGARLKQSIKTIPRGKRTIEVTTQGLYRPYDVFQELGYTPHIPPLSDPAIQILAERVGRWPVKVKKHTPFVRPAMERVPTYIDRAIDAFLGTELRRALK